jgi:uncharacterized protein (TIGR02611 family)
MKLADLIVEQRDRQVSSLARPHLDEGEDVIHWVRTRHPHERREGYAYLTKRRLLVVWAGSSEDGHGAVVWDDVYSWGVDRSVGREPLLGVESPRRSIFFHMPVASLGTARRVTGFVRRLERLAPPPKTMLLKGHSGRFEAGPHMEITVERMSASAVTKRILATLLGLVLVVGGVLITPIPGPWSLPIVLAGLAVLASEYDWAKDVLGWLKERSRTARQRLRARRAARRAAR